MAYAVRQDLVDRYGAEVAQRESALPSGAVDRALADAAAEIDSYCAGRYQVPLSPVPGNVLRIACALARYYLLGDAATETARADAADARALLRDIQAGRALLQVAAPLAAAAPAKTVEMVTGRDRVFGGSLA